jgi:hypothetical protein
MNDNEVACIARDYGPVFLPADLITGPVWRRLSVNARLALLRLEAEWRRCGRVAAANGGLGVSRAEFVRAGVPRDHISAALNELIAAGLIELTLRGGAGSGGPNLFLLAHRPHLTDPGDTAAQRGA